MEAEVKAREERRLVIRQQEIFVLKNAKAEQSIHIFFNVAESL